MIKRALISVSNKEGVVDFAKKLQSKNIEILSTGGTAKLLRKNKIKVVDVSDYTGHPEIMNGRVKTMHPKVLGGLLAVRDDKKHMADAEENKIQMIDLVVINLYPFAETVGLNPNLQMQSKSTNTEVELEKAIEQIDVGGPTMLRSAAKNFKDVTVVSDVNDYDKVWTEIEKNGDTTEETRRSLAEKVFQLTAGYDGMIANYLSNGRIKNIMLEKIADLRYGENPHQQASFYKDKNAHNEASLVNAEQLQGKELSYNNIMDADGALSLVREFSKPAVVFAKHANPCGVAIHDDINIAYDRAFEGDPKSAFGGIIAFNRTCTKKLAEKITGKFFEVVIAPDYDDEAIEIFKIKSKLRVLKMGEIKPAKTRQCLVSTDGGILIQDLDVKQITVNDLKVVTKRKPSKQEIKDLLFAWKVLKHVKSNAIVLVKDSMAVGIGAGQQSRVDAVELAVKKSLGRAEGSVMASDAFFPFPDGVEVAVDGGIKAVIQPGGSIKDEEVIKAADKAGVAMVFTGVRAFLH